MSDPLQRRLALPVTYLSDNTIGKSEGKEISDHFPLILRLMDAPPASRAGVRTTRFDVQALRDGDTAPYQTTLSALMTSFLQWRAALLDVVTVPTKALLEALGAGLVFCVSEAAYLALGTTTSLSNSTTAVTSLLTPAPSGNSPSLWAFAKRQKRAQLPSSHSFTTEETVAHMLKVANGPPPKGTRLGRERARVAALTLDSAPSITAAQRDALIARWAPFVAELAKKLRNHSAGGPNDRHQPELIKYAPPLFYEAVASFSADCAMGVSFPEALTDGLMSYIHKGHGLPLGLLTNHRGIRCTSCVGKLCVRLMADPIFPLDAKWCESLCPEQFAGRKKHNAGQLDLFISLLLHCGGDAPLYLVLLDISKAFDSVWREGLWAEMLRQGHSPTHVAWLRAVYSSLRTAVKAAGGISQFYELLRGIGQGDPNSTMLYGLLLSRLPGLLRTYGIGTDLFGIFIACLLFLDDVAIPCASPEQVRVALGVAHRFGVELKIQYNVAKGQSGVKCFNVQHPPPTWPMGDLVVHTTSSDKYLAYRFAETGLPRLHFDERIANARKRFKSLKSAGLIGGHNPASASIRLVEAEIWPLLDSGREAADLFLRDAVRNDIRRRLSVLQLEFSKDILGTSVQAVSAGVLGELGEIPEGIRNDGRMLGVLGTMGAAPVQSIPHCMLREMLRSASEDPSSAPPS